MRKGEDFEEKHLENAQKLLDAETIQLRIWEVLLFGFCSGDGVPVLDGH